MMELAAAPDGKTGRQEDMFSPQKMLAMEDRKMAVQSHKNSAVSYAVETISKGSVRNSSWASRLDVGSVGIIDISHVNAPDHAAKGGKEKVASVSVGLVACRAPLEEESVRLRQRAAKENYRRWRRRCVARLHAPAAIPAAAV